MNEKIIIKLKNLVKEYDSKIVLNSINLDIKKGEFVTLLGPSGSGKTTTLRLIGGFEWPTRGEIQINGRDVKDLAPYKRPISTIFQDYALFPFLNVEKNILYGLKLMRIPLKNPKISHLANLKIKEKQWNLKSKINMKKLDKEQATYKRSLKLNRKGSSGYKKAQKWLDSSDFKYSYWENYVRLRKEDYQKKYLSRSLTKIEIKKELKKVIELVNLQGTEKKSIDELSGGMKQRVALARSLVTKPQILLLDEPFSAIDLKVSQHLQRELKVIQKDLGITCIFVTHNQEEALTLSDKVAVMLDGKIMQYDSPQEIYDYPKNAKVASFIGESNLFEAVIDSENTILWNDLKFQTSTFSFAINSKIDVLIRPEDIEIKRSSGKIKGQIINVIYQGTFWEYSIKTDKFTFTVHSTKKFTEKNSIFLTWIDEDFHVMEKYAKDN